MWRFGEQRMKPFKPSRYQQALDGGKPYFGKRPPSEPCPECDGIMFRTSIGDSEGINFEGMKCHRCGHKGGE
jgi:hypothetical protein